MLRGADAHHLSRVMRGKLGDTVILCDGSAVEYTATITGFGDETVEFSVEPGYPSAAEPTVDVTLLVGYPKQDKLEQVIRHGVELGCDTGLHCRPHPFGLHRRPACTLRGYTPHPQPAACTR